MIEEEKSAKRTLGIILDSNGLLASLQFKIDVVDETKKLLNRNFEFILLSPVLEELERMAKSDSPKTQKNATYALKLTERCKMLKTEKNVTCTTDDLILQMAAKHKLAVFTNDRQLRIRLRNINVPVIYVRQKSRLEIDGRL